MKAALFLLTLSFVCLPLAAQPHTPPPKILIEDMADDLDTLVRAEIFERGESIEVVLDVQEADFVLTGLAPERHERSWRQGWLPLKKSPSATISLVSCEGEFVWAMEIPKQNRLWGAIKRDGLRKTAEKIASELSVAVEAIRVSP